MASPRPERDPERPVYVISVAASIVSAHPRTLRIYEDEGLLCPARTPTNIRLYSENDIRRILWIRHLTRERGVNLAGIRILFELEERLGARILEALYAEGTGDAEPARSEAPAPAARPAAPASGVAPSTTTEPPAATAAAGTAGSQRSRSIDRRQTVDRPPVIDPPRTR
jgi:MerR family transcriptional regulator, heat shock protein HspR